MMDLVYFTMPRVFSSTAFIKVLVLLVLVIGLLLGSLSSFPNKMGEDGTQYLHIDSHPAHEVTARMKSWSILWTIGGILGIGV
jgi:hypothetical protein